MDIFSTLSRTLYLKPLMSKASGLNLGATRQQLASLGRSLRLSKTAIGILGWSTMGSDKESSKDWRTLAIHDEKEGLKKEKRNFE